MAYFEQKGGFKKEDYLFLLRLRDQLREWLKEKGYIEILLPSLYPETSPDFNLESFEIEFKSVFNLSQKYKLYLQTSPELLMKRLISQGFDQIFYLGPAFRQGEYSSLHHPEFTIIEWYKRDANYFDLMDELEELAKDVFNLTTILRISFKKLLEKIAGRQFSNLSSQEIKNWLAQTNIDLTNKDDEEIFEFIIVQYIEPFISKKEAVFIYDYPACLSMQAKLKEDNLCVCERFEFYIRGIEVANGYSEEFNKKELEKRFKQHLERREKAGKKLYPIPTKFLSELKEDIGRYAGVAFGLERLALALLNLDSLDQILPFRELE